MFLTQCSNNKELKLFNKIIEKRLFSNYDCDKYYRPDDWKEHLHFILYKKEKVVCVAMVHLEENNVVIIKFLATAKKYERQGFAKNMLKLLEEWAVAQKRKLIKVFSLINSKEFYQKQGYTNYSDLDFYKRRKFDKTWNHIAVDMIHLGKFL